MIPLHLFASFQWSLSSSRAVFILPPTFPHQPTAGTGGISHRLSPAWTWSQKELSVAVYAVLSSPDGIKNESCCHKQGTRSVWSVPQAPCAPLRCTWCRFLSHPSCGCQFFLLTACPPDPRHTLCSHSPCTCLYPHHALTLWS